MVQRFMNGECGFRASFNSNQALNSRLRGGSRPPYYPLKRDKLLMFISGAEINFCQPGLFQKSHLSGRRVF